MKLTVRFMDGSVEVFDTDALTTESALGRTNALTDLRVTLDEGLWVEASWYRLVQGTDDSRMPLAQRSAGCRLHVLSDEEVGQVRSVELDGALQWLRVGPDLCEIPLFYEIADLAYDGDSPSGCTAGKAVWLHDLLRRRLFDRLKPAEAHARACAVLGMTEASFEYLSGLSASVYSDETLD